VTDLSKMNPHAIPAWKGATYNGFIRNNTKGLDVAVELGAGVFHNFAHIASRIKVGIELIPEYVEARAYKGPNIVALNGNALEFDKLLAEAGVDAVDVFIMCDFLEHIDKDDAVELIARLKAYGNRIIIFVPGGTCNQHGHEHHTFGDKVQFRNEDSAIEAQRHKSTWFKEDLEALEFVVDETLNYHNPDKDREKFGEDGGSVLWAVWNSQ